MITFLSRHYPPNANINGESVWDMVKYLKDNHDIESNVICIDRKAEGVAHGRPPLGNVTRIKTLYQGNNAALRFITFLYDGFMLVRKAKKYKDTLIVVTSSPPLLPFWASVLFGKNIRWAFWSLDLFPEAFNATGLISADNWLYKFIKKRTYKNAPDFLIALGKKQAAHLQDAYGKELPHVILPCGVFFHQDLSNEQPDWYEADKIHLGYCGNIGDAHNPELIKAAIDHIDPAKHKLILALYGTKAEQLKAYAKDKPGVVLVKRVDRNKLHFIDIHLVTLLREWTHIAVPSKALSAVFMGASILFCGSKESDNWAMLESAGWLVEENGTISQQVKTHLSKITVKDIAKKRAAAVGLQGELQGFVIDSYEGVAGFSKKNS